MVATINDPRYFCSKSTYWNSSVHYICDPGYRLEGDASLLCSDDGHWTSASSSHTSGLSAGADSAFHGSMRNLDDVGFSAGSIGATVDLYSLMAARAHGPRCVHVQCPQNGPPGLADHLFEAPGQPFLRVDGWAAGDIAVLTCPPGLVLRGRPRAAVTCMTNGQWETVDGRNIRFVV
jgi:hypothetical protein